MKSEIWVWNLNSGQLICLKIWLKQKFQMALILFICFFLIPWTFTYYSFFSFLPFLCQHHGLCLNYYPPVGLWCVITVTDIVISILLRFSQVQTMVAINFTWTFIITISLYWKVWIINVAAWTSGWLLRICTNARVPECLSAQVSFECLSAIVFKYLECRNTKFSFECSSALSAQVPKGPSSAQILRFPWSVFEKSFKIFSDYILLHTVFFFLENKMYKFYYILLFQM